jgi:hypothetical protein
LLSSCKALSFLHLRSLAIALQLLALHLQESLQQTNLHASEFKGDRKMNVVVYIVQMLEGFLRVRAAKVRI